MGKFDYEEGELKMADDQCHLCVHFNNGQRDEECPLELLESVLKGEIRCPKLSFGAPFERLRQK